MPITITFSIKLGPNMVRLAEYRKLITFHQEVSDYCLGYIDEARNVWVCEDYSLEFHLEDDGSYLVSAHVNHFTVFSILLGESPDGQTKENTGSSDSDESPPLVVIIVTVAVAAVLIAIAIIAIEVWRRQQRKNEERDMSAVNSYSMTEMIREKEKESKKEESESTTTESERNESSSSEESSSSS